MRYKQLDAIIAQNKPATIVEFGTWNGLRAVQMATEALKHQPQVRYLGIDLFENATTETDERELNVKQHTPHAVALNRLREFADAHEGFEFDLWAGDSRDAGKDLVRSYFGGPPDLAYIDGGHSIDTIRSDYEQVHDANVIVFDDYYVGDGCPDIAKFGCNQLLKEKELEHVVLPQMDPVATGGMVQMVITPAGAWSGMANVVIKTKNCVPDAEIQDNVDKNLPRIHHWAAECRPHGRRAVIVSAGPSLARCIDVVADYRRQGDCIVCVKHAHDALIENGVVPDLCILLDPRSHVQDFIENPHPDVTYLVATMVHPTTLDQLLKHKAKILGYHALVGAAEQGIVAKHMKPMDYPQGIIGGGSASSVRGLSVLITLGFRRFALVSLDCCYADKPAEPPINKTTGRPEKVMRVVVSGRQFWTNAELLAQAQDFDKMLKQPQAKDIDIECHGDGIISHIWNVARPLKPRVEDVLDF